MIDLIITGAAGKMGGRLIRLAREMDRFRLHAAIESKEHATLGLDAGEISGGTRLDLPITNQWDTRPYENPVLIDFTEPNATMDYLEEAGRRKIPMVIGTTGLNQTQLDRLNAVSEGIPCVQSPNMSVGINLLFKLLNQMTPITRNEYDVEIFEMHHRHKKDAPSGTALKMAQILSESMNWDLGKVGIFSRHGVIGERGREEIGIQSLRGGDVVGEHTVVFAGLGERIELTHRAQSRDTFARGALLAATWIVSQKPGLYEMQDVLGLR